MFRLTLAQMRRSIGRLTAAGIAVLIGTAFVAATLLAGDAIRAISTDSITASFGQADLVAKAGVPLTDDQLHDLRAVPGVAAVDPMVQAYGIELRKGDTGVSQVVIPVPSSTQLQSQVVTDGALPTTDGQISLPEETADRLGVGVGDTVTVHYWGWSTAAADATEGTDPAAGTEATAGAGDGATEDDDASSVPEVLSVPREAEATVVALTDDPNSAWASVGGAAEATLHDTLVWGSSTEYAEDGAPVLAESSTTWLTLALRDDADQAQVREDVLRILEEGDLAAGTSPNSGVYTREEAAELSLGSDGGVGPIMAVVLSFAAIALVVAGLVIANTFQVLVAQRTRTLALLRCVGAVRSQIRRSVLLEAAILGLVSSVAGLLVGTGLVQITLWVLGRTDLPFPVPSSVHLTALSLLVPLVVGVLVTVLAALTPARVATRVAPIAALRPVDAPAVRSRAGRVRLVLALLLIIGGVAMLGGGVAIVVITQQLAGLGLSILGGAVSFIGLLVSATFWMPKVVAGVGNLVGRLGMPARLAAANTGRNPARTAATSTALLIGVTLVAMMSTGAVTARTTLDHELDNRYPVDLTVGGAVSFTEQGETEYTALPAGAVDRIAAVDGVRTVAGLPSQDLTLTPSGSTDELMYQTLALSTEQAADLVRDPDLAAAIADDTVVIPQALAQNMVEDGDTVTLGSGGTSVQRTAKVLPLDDWTMLITPSTAGELGFSTEPAVAWIGLDDVYNSGDAVQDIQSLYPDSALPVTGAAVERATYQRAIDTVLAVVIGLLAVAVVIALVGVTNTLSLSVIERRRESATLRALGLTRRQLRASLAIEGALIAGVGAVVGTLLGLVYGWAGVASVLSVVGTVNLAVPWSDLGLVLGIALAAGVLASVVPSRSAARTPPVAALAEA
ncbi:ABC transporter permease [Cellulomonas denverensis]|uniref:FtsX-like permease family protein n=1 Tax=Cellulomonas denverensis TaxID=264297 RepID=A0A7X6KUD6_9CELL|nr:FtsX-like permease family protein [Cellulomonas denverensis]NKY22491.1 FtsX-like permease family protein [Cellulomonas denverensis]GIG25964.1 ABC transporter permease [Cellulomonas denverensis]